MIFSVKREVDRNYLTFLLGFYTLLLWLWQISLSKLHSLSRVSHLSWRHSAILQHANMATDKLVMTTVILALERLCGDISV